MFGALPFTTRMTVIKLESGGIWIHSPVLPTEDRCTFIDQLGPVRFLIAPNKIHSLGIAPWRALYPSAEVWASPEFSKRHTDIPVDALLTNGDDIHWSEEIDHCVVNGHAVLDEVVFLHKISRTLIVTDLIQKHETAGTPWIWRYIQRLAGISGKNGGVPLDIKLSIRNKEAMRQSIDTILGWDFDNLIISHGTCLEGGAKEEVNRAFDWLRRV